MMVNTFVNKAYQDDFMTAVHKLRQNNEYTDVTLQSGSVQIQCHRVVLAAASDYFKAMFGRGFKESASDTVQLTIEPEILTSIIDYIYTGEIQLTVDNVEGLVNACDVLQLDTLKAGCDDFLMSQVDITNCVGFFRFAALYRLLKVQRKARELMLAEFKAVAFTDQMKELSCRELIDYIKDDDIIVDDEDVVVDCVLEWVRHDVDVRKSSFETVLEYVRLPYCKSKYLCHMKNTCRLLTPKCLEYLNEATVYQANTAPQRDKIGSCRTVPRTKFRQKSRLLVVGGMNSSGGKNKICRYYNEDTSCWESLMEMPKVGTFYSVCCAGRSLLLTGGEKKRVTVDQCWLCDLDKKKWEAMPPLITGRDFHCSVSLGNCVYLVGGACVGDSNTTASVDCLNLKRREWLSMPDIPQIIWKPAIAAHGNKIFVFGGTDDWCTAVSFTQEFDTTSRKWSALSDMPVACEGCSAVTLDDYIYVVGGVARTCLRYHPATDTWTTLSGPRGQHAEAAAVVWRGCILLAGGGDSVPESAVIEEYDPVTDKWSEWRSELDTKLHRHAIFNVEL